MILQIEKQFTIITHVRLYSLQIVVQLLNPVVAIAYFANNI